MSGSKTISMTTDEMRSAQAHGRSRTDLTKLQSVTPFVWDGRSEEDRTLTRQEMQDGVELYRKRRGRPLGSDKESTTIRIDRDILTAFRAEGVGWQTRMNAALREWLETHRPTRSS